LISGSLDLVLDHFFPDHPFDHVLINRLHFDPRGKITGGVPTPYDLEAKVAGLEELARREALTVAECAFVGDNVNDLAVMRAAGFSVGVNIKSPQVVQAVDLVVTQPDLRSILPFFPGPGQTLLSK
jgi:phosphoserine phosphatase